MFAQSRRLARSADVAGPQDLQVFPPGLLSFLAIKNGGKNPQTLSDVLAGTIELRDWYFAQQWELASSTIADWGAGTGQLHSNVVPQQQIWWVRDLTVGPNLAMAAGNSATFFPSVLIQAVAMKIGPSLSLTAGQADWAFATGPFILLPGESFGVQVNVQVHAVAQPAYLGYKRLRMLL